jgi:hypothetical protein
MTLPTILAPSPSARPRPSGLLRSILLLVFGVGNAMGANSPPSLSRWDALSMDVHTGAEIIFDLADPDTPLADLTIKAHSSNQSVIPDDSIVAIGQGQKRALILAPLAAGDTVITVTVMDPGGLAASNSNRVTVLPRRDLSKAPGTGVSAVVRRSPPSITLVFPSDSRVTQYTLYRKTKDAETWGNAMASLPGSAAHYTDTGVRIGSSYEYRVVRTGGTEAYIYAGLDAPLIEDRGTLVLVIERTVIPDLTEELSQLTADLVGDGWQVIRREVSRDDPVAAVRELIKGVYWANPKQVRAVFLLGHVPVPYSGFVGPDSHPPHVGAWAADVYYGDMDATWSDESDNFYSGTTARALQVVNRNIPGDGKFDQSAITTPVELAVGRVDLSNMGAFLPFREGDLLRRYLEKLHQFKHGLRPAKRQAFSFNRLPIIYNSLWNDAAAMFGPAPIKAMEGDASYWQPLIEDSYLFARIAGPGDNEGISDSGPRTANFAQLRYQAVFTELFGSWFGDWDSPNNFLRAPLASSGPGLTAVWSGFPAWYFHPMALGETIGYSALLTQNRAGDTFNATAPNLFFGSYSGAHGIWMALMGDPTLRLHPVLPPHQLQARVKAGNVALSWLPSEDTVEGYHVYRASKSAGPYTRLTRTPVPEARFTDANAAVGSYAYMVRAVKLELSGSGTYWNASQGLFKDVSVFSSADNRGPTLSLTSPAANTRVVRPVQITAQASDDHAVAQVEFAVDGVPIGSATEAPYQFTWTDPKISLGDHTISVRATDTSGNTSSTSARVTLTTEDTVRPTVAIIEPAAGGSVFGEAVIKASALDNVGVDRVEFRADGVLVGTARQKPYQVMWEAFTTPPGPHTLSARAIDRAGLATETNLSVRVFGTRGNQTLYPITPSLIRVQAGKPFRYRVTLDALPQPKRVDYAFTFFENAQGQYVRAMADTYHVPWLSTDWSGRIAYDVDDDTRIRSEKGSSMEVLPPGRYKVIFGMTEDPDRVKFLPAPGVIDRGGNAYEVGILEVEADKTPPQISFNNNLNNSAPLTERKHIAGPWRFDINVEDNCSLDQVEWWLDGALQSRVTPTSQTTFGQLKGSATFKWDTSSAAPGAHTLQFRARDKAGNEAEKKLTLIVEPITVYPLDPASITVRKTDRPSVKYHWSGGALQYSPGQVTRYLVREDGPGTFMLVHKTAPVVTQWTGGDVHYDLPLGIIPLPGKYSIWVSLDNLRLTPGPQVVAHATLPRYQVGTLVVQP